MRSGSLEEFYPDWEAAKMKHPEYDFALIRRVRLVCSLAHPERVAKIAVFDRNEEAVDPGGTVHPTHWEQLEGREKRGLRTPETTLIRAEDNQPFSGPDDLWKPWRMQFSGTCKLCGFHLSASFDNLSAVFEPLSGMAPAWELDLSEVLSALSRRAKRR